MVSFKSYAASGRDARQSSSRLAVCFTCQEPSLIDTLNCAKYIDDRTLTVTAGVLAKQGQHCTLPAITSIPLTILNNRTENQKNLLELTLVLCGFLAVNILSQVLQQPVSFNNGRGWDGTFYYTVAEEFSRGQTASTLAPYVYRIGTPFMASLIHKIPFLSQGDLLVAFKLTNVVANFATILLLLFWLRQYINDWRIRLVVIFLFLTQWHGPVRFTYYYPVYVDPWFFAFSVAGLIGISRVTEKNLSILWLSVLVFFGTAFRETMMVIPLAALFVTNPVFPDWGVLQLTSGFPFSARQKFTAMKLFIPLVASVSTLFLIRLMAVQTNPYSFLVEALKWLYGKPLLTYLHSFFIAYGPIIVLTVFNRRRLAPFLLRNQYLCVYLIAVTVLAWIGGTDTERCLFWAMPVVYLLIGKSIQDNLSLLKSAPFLFALVLGQTISQRLFWTVPDYPNDVITPLPILTIPSNHFQYLDLYSYSGNPTIQMLSLLEYSLLAAILLFWLKRLSFPKQALS